MAAITGRMKPIGFHLNPQRPEKFWAFIRAGMLLKPFAALWIGTANCLRVKTREAFANPTLKPGGYSRGRAEVPTITA